MPSSAQAAADDRQRARTRLRRVFKSSSWKDGCTNAGLCPEFHARGPSSILQDPDEPPEIPHGRSRRSPDARLRGGRRGRHVARGLRVCRERAVVSGAAFLPRLFAFLSPPARVTLRVADGDAVGPGAVLAEIEGPAITVLAAERTALNLVQRLTGIATLTRAYADALAGTKAVPLSAFSSGTPSAAAAGRTTDPGSRAASSSRTTTRTAPARRGRRRGVPETFAI